MIDTSFIICLLIFFILSPSDLSIEKEDSFEYNEKRLKIKE